MFYRYFKGLGLTLLLSLNLISCASQDTRTYYRASDLLIHTNPANKIAIVAEAKVMRPRMGGKDAILSLSSSKRLLEDSLPKLKSAFEKKGYQVVYSEPAGVGYYWRGPDDYWVYDFDAKENGTGLDKWRVDSMEPVYEYPGIMTNRLIKNAARNEFERLNDDISMSRLPVYFPHHDNVTAIANNTGADTVCFARIWGKRYSAGRVAGDVALKVVAAMFGVYSSGGLQELKVANVACASAKTKQLLWINTHTVGEDPIGRIGVDSVNESKKSQAAYFDTDNTADSNQFVDTFFADAIATLPDAGQSYSGNCSMTNRARMVISCSNGKDTSKVARTY